MDRNRIASGGGRLITLSLALAAWASIGMTANETGDSGVQANQLEEVVVTANRRQENQQVVPIAITAISGDVAEKQGVANVLTLGESIPNVVFGRQSNGSIPFIRGVGNQNSTPGDEPAVATYVDDVYMPLAGSGISNFNSIDRLEVEKGPQGTLFGRNATGGVIQIYTKNPSAKPELDVNVGYANYRTLSGSIYATGALTSTLSANIAAYASKQEEGWGTNLTNHHCTFCNEQFSGGRVKLLWTPNDKINFLLTADYDKTTSGVGLTYRAAPGTITANNGLGPVLPGGSAPAPANFFDAYTNSDNISNNYQGGVSLKGNFDLGWASLTSISAYRTNNDQEFFDLDAGPAQAPDTYLHGSEESFTQEFRLVSPADSKLKWIAGVFYFNDSAGYTPLTFIFLGTNDFVSSIGVQKTQSYAGFAQASYEVLPKTNLTIGVRYTSDDRSISAYDTSVTQLAIPGNTSVTVPVCPNVGPVALFGGATGCMGGSNKVTYSKPSGKISLDYHFTDDVMGYVAYNRGFKSGLFNVVSLFTPVGPPVKPETLDAFSIGEKAEFLDHRVRLNTEAFYYDYSNIQVQAVINGSSFTTNAAKATMKGIEFDATVIPVQHLTLTGSIGIEEGHYGDFPNGYYLVYNAVNGGNCVFPAATSAGPNCGLKAGGPGFPPHYNAATGTWNLSGNKVPNLPPFSASLTAKYDIPTAMGDFDLNLAWNHTGNYYFNADNGQGQVAPSSPANNKQPILDLLNGSLSWTSKNDMYSASLWGKNITNVQYLSFGIETGFLTSWSVAPPRTFGITLGLHL